MLQAHGAEGPGSSSDEEGEALEDVPFEQFDVPGRPMPPSFALPIRPRVPRGVHWATGTQELPEDTQHVLLPSFAMTPWAELADKDTEVGRLLGCCSADHPAAPCHSSTWCRACWADAWSSVKIAAVILLCPLKPNHCSWGAGCWTIADVEQLRVRAA